jgi:hypothetical protein
MIERRIGNKIIQEYSSLLDFVEYAEGSPFTDGQSRDNSEDFVNFSGGTWQDAVSQAKTGNPELVQSMFDGISIINSMIQEETIGEMRDVTGEYFDVADYLSGEPEVFRREEYVDLRPVVPVYANFAMNCAVSNTEIKNRGCGIIALCDELVRGGYIVDLNMCESVELGDNVHYTKIKVSLDPLDLDSAAFIVANPLCVRRLSFAVLERSEDSPNCGSYGCPGEYDLDEISTTSLSGFYFTSSNHPLFGKNIKRYKTLKGTKEHICEMIEEYKTTPTKLVMG